LFIFIGQIEYAIVTDSYIFMLSLSWLFLDSFGYFSYQEEKLLPVWHEDKACPARGHTILQYHRNYQQSIAKQAETNKKLRLTLRKSGKPVRKLTRESGELNNY